MAQLPTARWPVRVNMLQLRDTSRHAPRARSARNTRPTPMAWRSMPNRAHQDRRQRPRAPSPHPVIRNTPHGAEAYRVHRGPHSAYSHRYRIRSSISVPRPSRSGLRAQTRIDAVLRSLGLPGWAGHPSVPGIELHQE